METSESVASPGMSSPVAAFLAERVRLTERRQGDGGPDVCRVLTDSLDRAIATLFEPLADERLAVVAIGGYGRGEQCLHSDVDVMLLHGGRLPSGAVEAVFYPLWDAKLKVGHAVRSVKDALVAARERVETLTALLDTRVIAGDAGLAADLFDGLAGVLRRDGPGLSAHLARAEHDRQAREPYQLLEANLKEGRGALRTLQSFHWQRRCHALLKTADPWPRTDDEAAAHATLLAARNGLHAAAGRPFELYAFDLRTPAAAWLGLDTDAAGRRLYAALRLVDQLARERWAPVQSSESRAGRPPDRAPVRRLIGRLRGQDGGGGAADGGPSPAARPPLAAVAQASVLSLADRALLRPAGARVFTQEEADLIRSSAGPAWDAAERAAFVRLLASGRRGWDVFTALDQLGWVGRALPEWRHVVAAPQHAPFHLHPLDVHLWRTLLELQQIAGPDSDEPWCAAAAAELGPPDDAYLAAVLHDIGKGFPGDHATVGAEIAAAFLRRARFGPAVTGAVTGAVRHHLLLPTIATRRDIDDPNVITHVADQAGDLRSLRILFLLSVADSRATGPTVWNPWKASLMRSLFARAADELSRRASALEHSPMEERILGEFARATAGRFEAALVDEHVAAMPPSYVTSFEISDLVRHLEAMTPPPAPGAVVVNVREGAPAANVIVVAEDRPGLLSMISGVFALHNVSVLDGRFYTRADGIVLDSFHVEDAIGGTIDGARWHRVRADLTGAVQGTLPLEDLLREKARAYQHRTPAPPSPVRALVDTAASDSFTIVEIHGSDRVGMLHDIGRALFDLGLDIRLAKIDTQGREVVDTFYVRGVDGEPVRDPSRLRAIERALRERLNGAGAP